MPDDADPRLESPVEVLDGGGGSTQDLLAHYDATTRTWDLPRESELWDAVALAHAHGRRGAGRTVAVVDDGFDTSVAPLGEHRLAWPSPAPAGTDVTHGTAVALLVLAVAPDCRLDLYPTRTAAGVSRTLVVRALEAAAASDAVVVNLSLGQPVPLGDVLRLEDLLRGARPWDGLTDDDLPFWLAETLADGGVRPRVRQPESALGTAAAGTVAAGTPVVAAVGNAEGSAYSPALRPEVVAAAFQVTRREVVEGGREDASVQAPSFSQSPLADVMVSQPAGVLGSSFAAPLVSGLAALMADPDELPGFLEVTRAAGAAAELMVRIHGPHAWSDRRDGVVDRLFARALAALPHAHHPDGAPCAECAFFCTDALVNAGLFHLEWGDLDGADRLLRTALAVAPDNPHAAANLSLVLARRAVGAQQEGRLDDVRVLLLQARDLQRAALRRRPEHAPYRAREQEFDAGAADPAGWTLQP